MLSEKLLGELLNMSRAEKLQVMQVLINDLNAEEIAYAPLTTPSNAYEGWLPYAAFEDAVLHPTRDDRDLN